MRIRAFAAAALLIPVVVRADPAAVPRQWSIGAGVSTVLIGGGLLSPITTTSSIPFVQASLERRVGGATWLVVGGAGTFETDDYDPQAGTGAVVSAEGGSSWAGHVALGLRRELTRAAAPFSLSALVLANVGGLAGDRRYMGFPPGASDLVEIREDAHGITAGISAGAAVERQLTPGLALRISSPLVSAGWSWTDVDRSDRPVGAVRAFRAGFALAPSLELRLAF